MQAGDFIEFNGHKMKIYGCVCRVNDKTVDYVRESLTRWTVDKPMLDNTILITEENFISRAKLNAEKSKYKIPSTKEVQAALSVFISNFDCDISEVKSALNY